jgi:hypothetical protein
MIVGAPRRCGPRTLSTLSPPAQLFPAPFSRPLPLLGRPLLPRAEPRIAPAPAAAARRRAVGGPPASAAKDRAELSTAAGPAAGGATSTASKEAAPPTLAGGVRSAVAQTPQQQQQERGGGSGLGANGAASRTIPQGGCPLKLTGGAQSSSCAGVDARGARLVRARGFHACVDKARRQWALRAQRPQRSQVWPAAPAPRPPPPAPGLSSMASSGAAPAPCGAAGSAGTGPNPISTRHPSILPLRVEGGRVLHAASEAGGGEGVVLERLAASLALNPRDSPPNALVFGIASPSGPVSQLDAALGSVGALAAAAAAGRARAAAANAVAAAEALGRGSTRRHGQ